MKKILTILGVFAFTTTPVMSVIACGTNEEANGDQGDNSDKAEVASIGELHDGSSLGMFEEEPTAEKIEETLKAWSINVDDVIVLDAKNGFAKITVREGSKVYKPGTTLTLTYGVGQRLGMSSKVDLPTVISSNDLGEFITSPSEAEILERFHERFSTISISDIQVDVTGGPAFDGTKGAYRADISVKDSSISFNRSWVHMNYTVKLAWEPDKNLANLSNWIKKVDLNSSSYDMHLSATNILDMLQIANPNLTDAMLKELQVVENSTGSSATIAVSPTATLWERNSSSIKVTFDPVINITSKEQGIWNRDLGNLEVKPTDEENMYQIISLIRLKNPNVIRDEIELRQPWMKIPSPKPIENSIFGRAEIFTKDNAKIYKGHFHVVVYFTVYYPVE